MTADQPNARISAVADDDEGDCAEVLRICQHHPQFVPVISNGLCYALNRKCLDRARPRRDMAAEDFVVGLELLGYDFSIFRDEDGLHFTMTMPEEPPPESWQKRATDLYIAFPPVRRDEILAYLKRREQAGVGKYAILDPACLVRVPEADNKTAEWAP